MCGPGERGAVMEPDQRNVPEPTAGLVVYDPEFKDRRWRIDGVAADGRIEAVRITPDDGMRHSWAAKDWWHEWLRGWLALDEEQR